MLTRLTSLFSTVSRALIAAALASLTPAAFPPPASAAEGSRPPLTNAQQVIDLGRAGARLDSRPIWIRGVITYESPVHPNWIYVQDDTGAVLVTYDSISDRPRSGHLVEVRGTAAAGSFHAYVQHAEVRILGDAPLPQPRRTPLDRLNRGADFGHWITMTCQVRDAAIVSNRLTLQVQSQLHPFYVWVTVPEGHPLPRDWIDAEIEVEGISWTLSDPANRPFSFRLHVPGLRHIRILRRGSTNTFDKKLVTSQDLRQVPGVDDTRIKVRGVVTYAAPGDDVLHLRDVHGPINAFLLVPIRRDTVWRHGLTDISLAEGIKESPAQRARPGDIIELVGAPSLEEPFAPLLHAGEYRIISHGPPPAPKLISGGDGLRPENDGELVRLRARYADQEVARSGAHTIFKFWLQADGLIFEARLVTGKPPDWTLRDDSLVEVTGICRTVVGESRKARGMRLHLRDAADVQLLRPSTPLLGPTAVKALAAAAALVIAALGWVWLLRRQVARQTAELRVAEAGLRRALEQEKELGEMKTRFVSLVSHEFRTPLGVIMSAADILHRYFDRLPAEKRVRHLEMILRSTKNLGALIEEVLLLGQTAEGRLHFDAAPIDLESACRALVDEVLSATGNACPIRFAAESSLAGAVSDRSLLRHILTNLLSNAVKYSEPGSPVEFSARREEADVVFTIRDHGIGIPPEDQPRIFRTFSRGKNVGERPGTGLGLVIVQRCVQLHGGDIQLASEPGHGTTITVKLPVFPAETAAARIGNSTNNE